MNQDTLSKAQLVLQESFLVVCRMPGTSGQVNIPSDKIPESLRSRIPQDLLSVKANLAEKETLKGLTTIRAQIARDLNALGTRFGMFDAYLIPRDNAAAAKDALDCAQKVYEAWVTPALDRLEASIEKKISSNPEYAEALRAAAPTRKELEVRMQFRRGIVTLGMAGQTDQSIDPGIQSEIETLPFQVAREIADDVASNWNAILLTPEARVAQRFRSVVERVRSKAKSMSYIEPKLRTLVDVIDDVLKRLPPAGPLTGHHIVLAQGLRALLLDPSAILGDQAIVLPEEIDGVAAKESDMFNPVSAGNGSRTTVIDPFSDPLRDTVLDAQASRHSASTADIPSTTAPQVSVEDLTDPTQDEVAVEATPFSFVA